jgi:hypothetical protein
MRKLLHICFAVIKNNSAFDPNFIPSKWWYFYLTFKTVSKRSSAKLLYLYFLYFINLAKMTLITTEPLRSDKPVIDKNI